MFQISYTDQFYEAIPQCNYRLKMSIHAKVLCPNASRSVSVTFSAVERYSIVSSMSVSTAGSCRKLSHESNLRGVASLLVELAAWVKEQKSCNVPTTGREFKRKPMGIVVLSCPKVFTIGRALGIHVRKSDLELFKLAAARLPHTQLVRLVVKKMESMSCRWGDQGMTVLCTTKSKGVPM